MNEYNYDVTLWENYRKSLDETLPNGGVPFKITEDGSIHNGMQILARCPNKRAAKKMLKDAGFHEGKSGFHSRYAH